MSGMAKMFTAAVCKINTLIVKNRIYICWLFYKINLKNGFKAIKKH